MLDHKMLHQTADLDTYIRQSQLLQERIVPFSAPTLWRRVKDGTFPQPLRLGPGVTAWKMSDIRAWQDAQNAVADK